MKFSPLKIIIAILVVLLTISSLFAQQGSGVDYNGVDSFRIGDRLEKFELRLDSVKGGFYKGKKHTSRTYQILLKKGASYKINTTGFKYIMLTFEGDSVLSAISFFNHYHTWDSVYSFEKGVEELSALKEYLSARFKRKGKYVNYSPTVKFTHYGYEWRQKGRLVKLIVQYTTEMPTDYSIDLYIGTDQPIFWQ